MMNSVEAQTALLERPLSRFQRLAIGVTVLLAALDGYDVLSVTYAASGILSEFELNASSLGVLLAAGLAGMAMGSLAIAPFGDVIGRRKAIFICLALMIIGMAAMPLADNLPKLIVCRLITGLGIGAMVSLINPLAAEYANAKWRDLAVALMAVGYPIGGTLGGLVATYLLAQYDWRSVFVFGAVAGLVMIPLVYVFMPNPIAYLNARQSASSLAEVNDYLRRCGRPEVSQMGSVLAREQRAPILEVFQPGQKNATLLLMFINGLSGAAVYYVLSWMPKLVTELGFSAAEAASVAVIRDLAGVVGGLLLGYLAVRWRLKRLVALSMVIFGLLLILFPWVPKHLFALQVAAGVMGFFMFASAVGFYALLSRSYPARIRASGTGVVLAFGRVCMAAGPLIGGFLFASLWTQEMVALFFTALAWLAALIVTRFQLPALKE